MARNIREINPKVRERRRLLRRELSRIKKALIRHGVKKIIWFGSFSRGIVGRATDLDLIVIKNTKLRYMDRLTEIYNAAKPEVACDIFVYTEEELKEMQRTSSFVRRALKEGKVLYAT